VVASAAVTHTVAVKLAPLASDVGVETVAVMFDGNPVTVAVIPVRLFVETFESVIDPLVATLVTKDVLRVEGDAKRF
jgi:hypothetical protein